jgi:two-component system sensor histidine kinase MprB
MELHYRRSLASRVTLLATMAVGFSVALVAVAAYFTVHHQLQASMDSSLLRRAHTAAQSPAVIELFGVQKVPAGVVGAADVKILFATSAGTQTAADNGPRAIVLSAPEFSVARGEQASSVRTVSTERGRYRVVAVPTVQKGLALVLAQSLESNEDSLDRLGAVLLFFGALGVIAAALAGWAVARNGLRPVRRLTDAAEDIARTENLSPIPVEGNDEIARLARSFNAMLAALSASRDRQRQLVADAGHELRTPLTSLRTNLDLLAQDDRRAALAQSGVAPSDHAQGASAADQPQGSLTAADRSELLNDVRAQVTELSELVGDLVELAREDSPTPVREPVDLADIVGRAVQRVARRAPDVDFDTECDPFVLYGDAASLERAVINLLDNAAKWSPRPGVVRTRLFHEVVPGDVGNGSVRNGAVLQIRDQGSGIQPTDLPHVFDRFYRSADARSLPGSGLGLAIVRQAVERHGGTVDATAADPAFGGGTVLTVRLPPSSSEALGPLSGSSQA